MEGKNRNSIQLGSEVKIVQKHHQRSGELTEGVVKRILTKSANHPHGIKVQLESGEVGRVKEIIKFYKDSNHLLEKSKQIKIDFGKIASINYNQQIEKFIIN